jgi:hypothetical protein
MKNLARAITANLAIDMVVISGTRRTSRTRDHCDRHNAEEQAGK